MKLTKSQAEVLRRLEEDSRYFTKNPMLQLKVEVDGKRIVRAANKLVKMGILKHRYNDSVALAEYTKA